MALSGLSSNPNFTNAAYDTIAGMAFGQAKAMLAEIKKHK
jgi:hypothetical protein